jgi:hypothetical protein
VCPEYLENLTLGDLEYLEILCQQMHHQFLVCLVDRLDLADLVYLELMLP